MSEHQTLFDASAVKSCFSKFSATGRLCLELVVALEKKYSVVIPDSEVGQKVFRSVNALAGYVKEHKK